MFGKKEVSFLVIILLLICQVGCASYRPVSLPILQPEFAPFSVKAKAEDITLSCKTFSVYDCERYLNRDAISKGFQPIQITIANESKKYLVFSEQGVSLPIIPAEDVAKQLHTDTVGRATAWGVGSLCLWPLLIPAVVDGVGSSNANKAMDSDFGAKNLKGTIIQPYGTMNGIIFVPTSEYNDTFSVVLIDRENKEKIDFRVHGLTGY